jgi:hypothetical protein
LEDLIAGYVYIEIKVGLMDVPKRVCVTHAHANSIVTTYAYFFPYRREGSLVTDVDIRTGYELRWG